VAVFERDKKFGNLFLAKLKTAITFAPGIRMTIIIYAFGVEKNFPCCVNLLWPVGISQTPKISHLLSFFYFSSIISYFSKLCLGIFHS